MVVNNKRIFPMNQRSRRQELLDLRIAIREYFFNGDINNNEEMRMALLRLERFKQILDEHT